ncbi:MAG: TetR/AcrR family transcriptional regulator [Ornithinimicrobium sp.]|uniref:TetR/AcrR family transcriptional regulator n=1 Tax=Ornithinimicrobium sp. TaxID=1977084 RepID=UPI0026E0CF4C|nr:TetR/AcrR family transcriptional regulator [Ornithinimicrobium sp.]MDO5739115.1 TetR/AcrR family transcriptional regulator [Ornithinimicrobium sp.]
MTGQDLAPPASRVRLPHGERRALLLKAALTAFSENGYHATAMDDIANRAGVSKPVLYQHFDSKLDLYLALAHQARDTIISTVEAALASTSDNAERIAATIDAFFEFIDRPDSGYPLILASDMGSEPAVAAVLDEAQHGCAAAVGRVLQEQTDLTWEECVLLGIGLVNQVQAAARHWYESGSAVPRQQAANLVMTLAWRGIGYMPPLGTGSAAEVVSRRSSQSG